jgi:hypothetical protein
MRAVAGQREPIRDDAAFDDWLVSEGTVSVVRPTP